jgi:hypothetical protein
MVHGYLIAATHEFLSRISYSDALSYMSAKRFFSFYALNRGNLKHTRKVCYLSVVEVFMGFGGWLRGSEGRSGIGEYCHVFFTGT